MTEGFRSLLVSDIVPGRPASGAVQRLALVTRELAAHGRLDALFVPVGAGEKPDARDIGPFDRLHVIGVPPPGPAAWVDSARRGPSAAYQAHRRRGIGPRLPAWVTETRYDLVWYNRERMWLPLRGRLSGPTVLDVDDVEEVLIEQWLRCRRGPHGRPLTPWQFVQARRSIAWWRAVHRLTTAEVDVVVHSRPPQDPLWRRSRTVVVPNTYARPPRDPEPEPVGPGRPSEPTVLFQGTFHWPPNADAARWLVRRVVPLIRRSVPDLRVVLAGPAPPRIHRLADGSRVRVLGAVPDMTVPLNAADLVVVPLRAGSGTRIKILEAFAHGVPVVSTSIGAAGLDVEPGRHLAVADGAAGLARACVTLLRDRAERERLTANGRRFQAEHHRPDQAAAEVRRAVRLAVTTG
jgi:glycosyltransferase involved in cell wall biosynthesis